MAIKVTPWTIGIGAALIAGAATLLGKKAVEKAMSPSGSADSDAIPDESTHDTAQTPQVTRATIRRGSRGADVEYWQGIIGAVKDGIFGPITEAKTRTWQQSHGLVVDGIVGPKTWGAAYAEQGGTPPPATEPNPLAISPTPPPVYTYTSLGPNQVAMKSTPLSRGQANYAIREAFYVVEGRYPTDNELRMLSAHSALETGNWGTGLHNYNFGNFRGSPYFKQRVPEYINGQWVKVDQQFKSYATASDGAEGWLRVLKRNWPSAWAILDSNDPADYSDKLKNEGRIGVYYTASQDTYTSALTNRYA
jgi:hypothetical protein